jgi:hypothetical protein
LPHDLKVSKEKLDLKFNVVKRPIGTGWIIFAVWLLIFSIVCATYFGVRYVSLSYLNKDIDGDGIADVNIDINNDNKADINISGKKSNKPYLNIDYKGNRRAVFNIDLNGDGEPNSNLVNDATDNKECSINCDIDGDGWPDLNIDLDGDGVADTDIDTDGDGVADLNLDLNGDGVCDIMCDTDNDNVCDVNCIKTVYNGLGTGSSTSTGNPNTESGSTMLVINYVDGETVSVSNLVPDDQPLLNGETITRPYKTFTIENLSDYSLEYSLKWNISYNTFVSNNFQYKVTSTNGGANLGYQTVPKTNEYIVERVTIPARTSQKYTIEFNLKGTGSSQNEDQSKTFRALIEVET